MKLWPKIKLGLIPVIIIGISVYLAMKLRGLWRLIDVRGLHLVGNDLVDVPINIAILLVGGYLLGWFSEVPKVKALIKESSLKLPIIGGLVYAVLVPHDDVKLVEIKTLWGLTPAEENWEYALVTYGPWPESDGTIWYRIHTLGWAGKLFSRVGKNNVRDTGLPDREVWMVVISMGLLNPPRK